MGRSAARVGSRIAGTTAILSALLLGAWLLPGAGIVSRIPVAFAETLPNIDHVDGDPARLVARMVPLDRCLIETDSPYLAPVPYRGKRCEPAYVKEISETAAQVKGKFENLKGKIKEVAGIVTGQRKREAEGKDQRRAGKAREKLGQVEKVFGK